MPAEARQHHGLFAIILVVSCAGREGAALQTFDQQHEVAVHPAAAIETHAQSFCQELCLDSMAGAADASGGELACQVDLQGERVGSQYVGCHAFVA